MQKSKEFLTPELRKRIEYIQGRINEMKQGNIAEIIEGACSGVPLLQINAMLLGAKFGVRDERFRLEALTLRTSEIEVFHEPISECAIAACDVLGFAEYKGTNKRQKEMIINLKNGTLF